MMYNKWWKQKGGAGQCDVDDSKKDANALAIANVGGVFVVLVAGLGLSLIVAILEFVWKSRKTADDDQDKVRVIIVHILPAIVTQTYMLQHFTANHNYKRFSI